jgi:cryptochrome
LFNDGAAGRGGGWQRKAKCVIGTDYPRPVVDHDVIHKENIAKMAAAYNAGKEGAAPKQKPAKKQKV